MIFEGFELASVAVDEGVSLRVRSAGAGAPVVLLHGHPRTLTTWYRVAPLLLEAGYTVVCPDLRGYGQSSTPGPDDDHSTYSDRAMARDVVALMGELGHERFAVVGHDRGSYVAYRTALDHPDNVTKLAVLDGVPIVEALERADARFAELWWHWFFFSSAHAVRVVNADPIAWYRPDRQA
ncbi:MAG: alpha/beta hydrolase, partial [Pedococcus sp.]